MLNRPTSNHYKFKTKSDQPILITIIFLVKNYVGSKKKRYPVN